MGAPPLPDSVKGVGTVLGCSVHSYPPGPPQSHVGSSGPFSTLWPKTHQWLPVALRGWCRLLCTYKALLGLWPHRAPHSLSLWIPTSGLLCVYSVRMLPLPLLCPRPAHHSPCPHSFHSWLTQCAWERPSCAHCTTPGVGFSPHLSPAATAPLTLTPRNKESHPDPLDFHTTRI